MTDVKSTIGQTLACGWHKCKKSFVVTQSGQKFCPGGKCKDAHYNWLKMTGIHLCPRALYYVKGLAEARNISNDEMANEMILKMANPDGQPLTSEEATGINGLMTP